MGKKNEMFDLVRGLKSLSASVELASKNGRAEYALKDMVEKIRNVVSDAEHAICMFTVERKKHSTSEAKCFSGEIRSIRDRVKKIKEDHAQAVKALIYNNSPITGTYVIQLADRLGEVVEENVSLPKEIKNQVEGLVGDIENFEAWRSNDNVVEDVMKQIRKVVMTAEDAICKYRAEKKHREKKWLRSFESPAYYSGIRDSVKEIKAIRHRIREIKESSAAADHTPTPITDTYYEIQLADRLGEVVDENVWLLKEIKKQVDGLVSDIKNLEAYLKQASRNSRSKDNDLVEDMVEKIRNVVIKAEDAICKYTVEKKKHKDKGWLRYFQSPAYYSRITASAKEIKAIRDDFKEIWESNAAALQALTDDHGEAQPAIPVMVSPTNHAFFFPLNIKSLW
nr:putative late blight resistance protein homolog R1B-14 [Ipomoea batatas]